MAEVETRRDWDIIQVNRGVVSAGDPYELLVRRSYTRVTALDLSRGGVAVTP
jgi:hypothetical protein